MRIEQPENVQADFRVYLKQLLDEFYKVRDANANFTDLRSLVD